MYQKNCVINSFPYLQNFIIFSIDTLLIWQYDPKNTYVWPQNCQYLYIIFVKVHESLDLVLELSASNQPDAYNQFWLTNLFRMIKNDIVCEEYVSMLRREKLFEYLKKLNCKVLTWIEYLKTLKNQTCVAELSSNIWNQSKISFARDRWLGT